MGRDKGFNPVEAHKKAQRKKQAAKEKKSRVHVREAVLKHRDVDDLREDVVRAKLAIKRTPLGPQRIQVQMHVDRLLAKLRTAVKV